MPVRDLARRLRPDDRQRSPYRFRAGRGCASATRRRSPQSSGSAPFARLSTAYATNWGAAGDTFFVSDNHAETQSSASTITGAGSATLPCSTYCVGHTVAAPPGSSNLKTPATVTTTGNSAFTLTGGGYFYGITFNRGSGATTVQFGSTTDAI